MNDVFIPIKLFNGEDMKKGILIYSVYEFCWERVYFKQRLTVFVVDVESILANIFNFCWNTNSIFNKKKNEC